MESIWKKTAEKPRFGTPDGDRKTDVLIIGGGLAGILCAMMLDEAGVDYMLVEADRICGGITGNTTAKLTFQHGLIYDKLISTFGTEKARLYLDANRAALEKYRGLCKNIDCDFAEQDSYVYSMDDQHSIKAETEAYRRLGVDAEFSDTVNLPFDTAGAVRVRNQAQFHPLKFAYSAARGLKIFENTKVLEMKPGEAVTNRGRIRAEKIIIATHFPFLNKHGSYFLKLYQHRSYVIAMKNAAGLNGMYVDESKTGMSFRNHGDLLFIGGGGHRTGKKGGNWRELTDFARRYYPDAEETARWAAQDCMTLDGMPYIGQYSKRTPDLYVTTGFNKWGMTSAMAGAMILADLVRGRENPYAGLFSPSRSVLHPQLFANGFESAVNLITPTTPRCPHLGCALKYNKAEHSWDCPCHGSRFSENGQLIDNPASDDMKIR